MSSDDDASQLWRVHGACSISFCLLHSVTPSPPSSVLTKITTEFRWPHWPTPLVWATSRKRKVQRTKWTQSYHLAPFARALSRVGPGLCIRLSARSAQVVFSGQFGLDVTNEMGQSKWP